MDLNQLLFDHQIALIDAARAPAEAPRRSALERANDLAVRIDMRRRELGAASAPIVGSPAHV